MTPTRHVRRLDNYLKTYRKRSGLSQREVAFLLGWHGETQVCRLEKRRRLPTLRTALRYVALFGAPISELFGGIYDRVASRIRRRAIRLERRLNAHGKLRDQDRLIEQKLRFLAKVGETAAPDKHL